ncbi:MAG: hypothetical protein HFH14_04820 [Lachnospiraceae bacterium]|nr:hypothetical protein [Lachnospiraceae bacterium]
MSKNCIKKTIVVLTVLFAVAAVFPYTGGNPVVSAHHSTHTDTHRQKNQKTHGKCYLNKKNVALCTGESYALKLKGGKGKTAWTSSDKSVATVTKKGRIKAVGKGTCTVKCRNKKKVYKCKVKVKNMSKQTSSGKSSHHSSQNQTSVQQMTLPLGNDNKGYVDNNGNLCNYFIKYDLNNILSLSDGTSAACPYRIYRQSLNGVPITYNGLALSAADLKPGDVLKVTFTYPQKCIYPCPIENITAVEVTDRKPEYAQIKYYYDVSRTDGDNIYILLNGNEFAISAANEVKSVTYSDGTPVDKENAVKTGDKIRIYDDNGCDIDPGFFRMNPFNLEILK